MTPKERNEQVLTGQAIDTFLASHERDLHATHLWMVNEIIVSLWDYDGQRPSVKKVKDNWRFGYGQLDDVTDFEIANIISNVSKYYN